MQEADIPSDMMDAAEETRQKLIEDIAESSEELLEKYLEGQELSTDEIDSTIRTGVKDGSITCFGKQ